MVCGNITTMAPCSSAGAAVPDCITLWLYRAERALALPGSRSSSHDLLRAGPFAVPIVPVYRFATPVIAAHTALRRDSCDTTVPARSYSRRSQVDGRTALLQPPLAPRWWGGPAGRETHECRVSSAMPQALRLRGAELRCSRTRHRSSGTSLPAIGSASRASPASGLHHGLNLGWLFRLLRRDDVPRASRCGELLPQTVQSLGLSKFTLE